MVLLPEERGMTLAELRQIAARQQHQIEAQQQLLVAKEQRLKFLKQQEARHHSLSEQQLETNCLLNLRDKVEAQELKLRQLRALRGQVEQQKTNNGNLGTELDSIRALFCEKEKELDLAVNKVEELTRQLDEIRKNNRKNYLISSTSSDLENLKRELLYRTKLSEQQNTYICQQREKIANKQQDIALLDKKINELNKRLHRKRLLNDQYASQLHIASISRNSNCSTLNNGNLTKMESRSQDLIESEHAQDDLAANFHGLHKCDFGEFSLTKNDPKYQTLPYNTKFTLKEKQFEDSLSSSTEDESWSSRSENSTNDKKFIKPFSNMCNFSPRPFNNSVNTTSAVQKVALQISNNENQELQDEVTPESNSTQNVVNESKAECDDSANNNNLSSRNSDSNNKIIANREQSPSRNKPYKPAVPPKPALSVKPMIVNQESSSLSWHKDVPEADSVNMALNFLKNKSTEKEKNEFRYSNMRDPSQDPLIPKSRILTYFSKTLLQPDGNVHHDQNEKGDQIESTKRKPAFVQLPIKPKPLTIRKTPGLEPPKLKVQPTMNSVSNRKTTELPVSLSMKISKSISLSESDKKTENISVNSIDSDIDLQVSSENEKSDICEKNENLVVTTQKSNRESFDNKEKIDEKNESSVDETDYTADQSDIEERHRPGTTLHKIKKGNLKGEGSIRGSRRVSFDPLALLLDAALEGELELVKKIAKEVINPSAANDEGITALHNAICAGHFDVVKFLVEFGCDVNAQDSEGWTPLHCAASCNNLAMVKFLVERGACIFATTLSDHETAAEKCEEDGEGFDGCSEYLFSLQENLGIMNNGIVYAVYDYEVQNADELSFKNGDMLTVLRKSDDEENEWWWSRLNDEEGYVPRNLLGLYPRVTAIHPNAEKLLEK